jgi:hypothetical protein
MNKFYYIDLKDDVNDSLVFFEIETDLSRKELVSFLQRKAKEYCQKNNIAIEDYDDNYIDYDLFEVQINKIHYCFRIATFLGNIYDKHLFSNLKSIFTKIKLLKEETI